jgi:dephospho-CoA kinase
MKLIGLTGGIGMGKSTAGDLLREWHVPVIDTDSLAHELVQPGQPALEEIKKRFGSTIISHDGRLRRDELAKVVFSNPEALRALESILHPPIRNRWSAEAQTWREQGHSSGVVIIPLLFETECAASFDEIICLACSHGTQWERLHQRGWSNTEIKQRIDAQWPVERKMTASHRVIWTDTTLEVHAAQLKRVIQL